MSFQDEYDDLLAPENFAMVETGVYRSAFPRSKNIPFLRSLRLRAVVALIPEDYPVHMTDFYDQCGVKLISHGLDGNKWPFKEIDEIGSKKFSGNTFMFQTVQRKLICPLTFVIDIRNCGCLNEKSLGYLMII